MDPIKIGSIIPAEKMHNIIEIIPKKGNININYEEYKDRYVYSFSLGKKKIEKDIAIFNILAQFVKEIIVNFHLKDLIKKNIKAKNIHMDKLAKEDLTREVYSLITDDSLFIREKDKIYNEVCDYLMENKTLIVDGYIRFRSNSLNELIDKAIEFAMDYIQMEIEYDEFIDMLKYLVDSNPPEMDQVDLILKDNDFELLDSNHDKIDNEDIVETLKEFFQGEVNKSDILLSSLIGISPKKIIVHVEIGKEKELIRILKKIFTHRINLCYDCDLCNIKRYKE